MSNEFSADLITLIDEEGTEHEFEILDVLEKDGKNFYALIPNFESPDESVDFDGMYFIFEERSDGEDKQLIEVEDDDLLDELAETFEKRFEDMYEYNEKEENN